jgi:hypothetical protein
MPVPSNYNSSSIDVDPFAVKSAGDMIVEAIAGLVSDMKSVHDALDGLLLKSWAGDTDGAANVANDWSNHWNDLVKLLLGEDDSSDGGLLQTYADGIGGAAIGYSRGERSVSDMWALFQAVMEGEKDPLHSWDLHPDESLEDYLYSHPAPHPPAPDYTQESPAEVKSVDQPSGGNKVKQYHTTSVNEQF